MVQDQTMREEVVIALEKIAVACDHVLCLGHVSLPSPMVEVEWWLPIESDNSLYQRIPSSADRLRHSQHQHIQPIRRLIGCCNADTIGAGGSALRQGPPTGICLPPVDITGGRQMPALPVLARKRELSAPSRAHHPRTCTRRMRSRSSPRDPGIGCRSPGLHTWTDRSSTVSRCGSLWASGRAVESA